MIISWNFYYASPGNAAAVLQQRIKASDVRAQLGLPRGRIISKIEGDDDFPDVAWRLDFADMAAQDSDMRVRASSPEFEAIRHGMRQLYRRFERPLYAPCVDAGAPVPVIAAEQTLLLYGFYCEESAATAVRDILIATTGGMLQPAEYMSGGENVPRFICETGAAGMPAAALTNLARQPTRIERSVWQVADRG